MASSASTPCALRRNGTRGAIRFPRSPARHDSSTLKTHLAHAKLDRTNRPPMSRSDRADRHLSREFESKRCVLGMRPFPSHIGRQCRPPPCPRCCSLKRGHREQQCTKDIGRMQNRSRRQSLRRSRIAPRHKRTEDSVGFRLWHHLLSPYAAPRVRDSDPRAGHDAMDCGAAADRKALNRQRLAAHALQCGPVAPIERLTGPTPPREDNRRSQYPAQPPARAGRAPR